VLRSAPAVHTGHMTNGHGRDQGPSHLLDASANPESFDVVVLPHLEAANRLARWLMRNEDDAEDVVQEASLRAFRYFHTFTGGNARAWLVSRELDGLSYQEMADAMSIPVGTVMSGLSRAREAFRGALHRSPVGPRKRSKRISTLSHLRSASRTGFNSDAEAVNSARRTCEACE